jgi:hypothetical protein
MERGLDGYWQTWKDLPQLPDLATTGSDKKAAESESADAVLEGAVAKGEIDNESAKNIKKFAEERKRNKNAKKTETAADRKDGSEEEAETVTAAKELYDGIADTQEADTPAEKEREESQVPGEEEELEEELQEDQEQAEPIQEGEGGENPFGEEEEPFEVPFSEEEEPLSEKKPYEHLDFFQKEEEPLPYYDKKDPLDSFVEETNATNNEGDLPLDTDYIPSEDLPLDTDYIPPEDTSDPIDAGVAPIEDVIPPEAEDIPDDSGRDLEKGLTSGIYAYEKMGELAEAIRLYGTLSNAKYAQGEIKKLVEDAAKDGTVEENIDAIREMMQGRLDEQRGPSAEELMQDYASEIRR